ncbi:MAG: DUF885 domain-containing protein [Bacteroidetes bacterium]|nr:DUF885 domain-containing protein [Bacteroidota bacterium]
MVKIYNVICCLLFAAFAISCNSPKQNEASDASVIADSAFKKFETKFLDEYWHQYPSQSIYFGYGKYYDILVIPDSASFIENSRFSTRWLDSLHTLSFDQLSDNYKISYRITENQLQSDRWYNDTLKPQEWNPGSFNISGDAYALISQPFAPLDQRLRLLSKRLANVDAYYNAALHTIHQPTKEHTALAVQQNEGGLDVFGASLADSIRVSQLTDAEKDTLQMHVAIAVQSMKRYTAFLKQILADKKSVFRDFRLSKDLYTSKFKYDMAASFSPEEIFKKSMADKNYYHGEMYALAVSLWPKYCGDVKKPSDSLELIKAVVDKISLLHASPKYLLDTLTRQVHELEHFIIAKNLFNYDTNASLKVRTMPAYQSGFALANAEFIPPYQEQGTTYFNVEDMSKFPAEKVEGTLREYNDFSLQFLTIHEAMPGHCMQGIYSKLRSPDIIKSVFSNGTMIEGWAVYTETMMLENGWGDHSPEMQLIHDKWKLRELCNVIVDYGLHQLHYSKEAITKLLKNDAFQTDAQIEEKYHRATVSQVQLCSYYTGMLEILALREDFKKKMGDKYSLKDFHEKFLSYGCSPVKYIREMMMK